MAIDSFLKLEHRSGPPANGESLNTLFKGWTDLSSYDLGVENVAAIGSKSAGAGAGKANFKEFSITKHVDSVTPSLFHACTTGSHYPTVELALVRAGGAKATGAFLRYEFKLVFVTNVDWDASSGDDVPRETVVFRFGAMRVTYKAQRSDGGLVEPGTVVEWSQVLNKATFQTE